jgi:hypothetical protein
VAWRRHLLADDGGRAALESVLLIGLGFALPETSAHQPLKHCLPGSLLIDHREASENPWTK